MSIKAIDAVWTHSRHRGGKLLLLLAIADFANDNGVAWPSIATLAKKARMSDRNAQACLREMLDDHDPELSIEEGAGPHGTHLYHILLTQGEKSSGVKKVRGEKRHARGEKFDSQGVKPASPNPSLESVIIEPSDDDVRASARSKVTRAKDKTAQKEPARAEPVPPDPRLCDWLDYFAHHGVNGINRNILAEKAVRDHVAPADVDALIEAAGLYFQQKGEPWYDPGGWLYANVTTHGWRWPEYPQAKGPPPRRKRGHAKTEPVDYYAVGQKLAAEEPQTGAPPDADPSYDERRRRYAAHPAVQV